MPDLAPFPDVEAMLVTDLSDLGTTGTVTPADLSSKLPFLRIIRLPGGSGTQTRDGSSVEITVFAATRSQAWSVARAAQQRMISRARYIAGHGALPVASTDSSPHNVSYEDPNIRVVRAIYGLSTRRR